MDPKSVFYLKLADERTVTKSKWINIFYFRQSIVYKMKVSQKISYMDQYSPSCVLFPYLSLMRKGRDQGSRRKPENVIHISAVIH